MNRAGARNRFVVPPDRVALWLVIGACCALPVIWIVAVIVSNPRAVLTETRLDGFRAALLGRTLLYNGAVAIFAVLLALPAVFALGRGRRVASGLLWLALPVTLLLPSLTYAYGWKQCLRLLGNGWAASFSSSRNPFEIEPASFADVVRCTWSLATWLYPVPAMLGAMALRRMDASVQQQALLDGAYVRVTLRQLLGPLAAAAGVVMVLSLHEFAVYEPTGISVTATETRMVFETGAFSSPDNPITQAIQGSGAAGLPDQAERAAAAVGTSVPMLAVLGVLGVLAGRAMRRISASEAVDVANWPRALDARPSILAMAWAIVGLTLLVPAGSLVLSLSPGRGFSPVRLWAELGPHLAGSLVVATIAGTLAALIALLAVVRRSGVMLIVALASFLIGGQLIAIALIRIYNRPSLSLAYESAAAVVMAYLARFGWIALAAAAATWGPAWRSLRDLAACDGAAPWDTARLVIWPIAWPTLAASALFILALSLAEVPATVLLSPQKPQMLVPLLMTWVHMLRYDPMIEASLLMAGIVLIFGGVGVGLVAVGRRAMSNGKGQRSNVKSGAGARMSRAAFHICLLTLALCHLTCLPGCDPLRSPEQVWLETGIADGQVVYPRAIAYSKADDTFFVCDRTAHIQHLDAQGRYLRGWHMPQSEQGKPVGLTVGPDGLIYVPDTHYFRVIVYKPDGTEVRRFGSRGTEPGQFIYPTDIAFDTQGNVFVSEYGDHDRIQVFDGRDGRFLYSFGSFGTGDGQFNRPQSMLIDGGTVYVTDACNHRICVFKVDGTWLRNMGGPGGELGQFRFPYGLDMDTEGNLIVCEFGNNRVQKIDKHTGKGLAVWGRAGREPGELAYPWGIAVDKRGRVVAVDAGNNRLQVFEF